MMKLVPLFIAAAAIATPAVAESPIILTRDGITYVGTSTERDGVQHIVGHELASHRRFDLVVAHGWVSGSYDGDQVSYRAPKPTAFASR